MMGFEVEEKINHSWIKKKKKQKKVLLCKLIFLEGQAEIKQHLHLWANQVGGWKGLHKNPAEAYSAEPIWLKGPKDPFNAWPNCKHPWTKIKMNQH